MTKETDPRQVNGPGQIVPVVRTHELKEVVVFIEGDTDDEGIISPSVPVHVEKADYNCVMLTVHGDTIPNTDNCKEYGVWFGIGGDGKLHVELFDDRGPGQETSFKLVNGTWEQEQPS